jgi:N6-L-threonylcarbamoyladenine synthase
MNVLGIESSCDETSASVVVNGETILSNVVASSLKDHQRFGGIIPEIASRKQLEVMPAVVQAALQDAKLPLSKIHLLAVTHHPGLIGSLLVGLSLSRALGFVLKKPVIEVNHIQAHLYANFLHSLKQSTAFRKPQLPAIGLIVSGGHTALYQLKDYQNFRLLGQTLDDAAGEAFDKVAKILKLGYPGGPVIDRIAQQIKRTTLRFPCAELPNSFNFSFSGIKTSVWHYVQKHQHLPPQQIAEIAFAFQESVISILCHKAITACQKKKVKTLLVGGGVAANSALRNKLKLLANAAGIKLFFPPLTLCLDNAAMVAGYAYHFAN